MLLGPALYLYVLSALTPHTFTLAHKFWHLLPALMMAIALAAGGLHSGYTFIPDLLIITSLTGYWLAAWHKLLYASANNQPAPAQAKKWLWVLIAFMSINIVVDVATTLEIRAGTAVTQTYALNIGGVFFAVFNVLTLLLVLTRAPLLEWMHQLKRPSPAAISPAAQQQLFERWQIQVHEKNLHHTDQGITLARAARMLGVPAKALSQAINSVYGASFSQHLNDIRVSHAKSLLQSQPNLTINEVLLQAGFSTKSHFHREFTRVTGSTPSAYREQVSGI